MSLIGVDGKPVHEDQSLEGRSGVSLYSPSRITKFMDCQNQYRETYIHGGWGRPAASMTWGTALHKALELHCQARIQGSSEPGTVGLKEIFAAEWAARKEDTEFKEATEYSEMGQEGERVITAIFPWIDSLKPRRVEFKVERMLPGKEYGVCGYVDLEETDATICDFKTTAKSPSKDDLGNPKPTFKHLFQLLTYAYSITGGEEEVPGKVAYIVRKKKPLVVEAKTLVTPEMMASFVRQADIWINAIRTADLFPPNRASTLCSERFCSVFDKCHEEF